MLKSPIESSFHALEFPFISSCFKHRRWAFYHLPSTTFFRIPTAPHFKCCPFSDHLLKNSHFSTLFEQFLVFLIQHYHFHFLIRIPLMSILLFPSHNFFSYSYRFKFIFLPLFRKLLIFLIQHCPVADTFTVSLGGGEANTSWKLKCMPCKTYTEQPSDWHCVEKRQRSWRAIAMKTCKWSERELGVWGLAPEKFLRPCPLECPKTPFCKVGFECFSSLIFMLRKKNWPLTMLLFCFELKPFCYYFCK